MNCQKGYIMSADGVCQPRGGYTTSAKYHGIVNKNDMGTGAVGADCCMSAMQAMNDCYAQSGFCDFGCMGSGNCSCSQTEWNPGMGHVNTWDAFYYCHYTPSMAMISYRNSCCGGGGTGPGWWFTGDQHGGWGGQGGQGSGRKAKGGPIRRRRRRR